MGRGFEIGFVMFVGGDFVVLLMRDGRSGRVCEGGIT